MGESERRQLPVRGVVDLEEVAPASVRSPIGMSPCVLSLDLPNT